MSASGPRNGVSWTSTGGWAKRSWFCRVLNSLPHLDFTSWRSSRPTLRCACWNCSCFASTLVIAAHANSTHGVAMRGLSFGGQTKIAFTQDPNLHVLEVTDLESASRRSTARFFDGSKPEYPRRMHCIQGSDAHRLVRDLKDKNRTGIGDRVTEVLLPEVSFEALLAVFAGDDFTLTRPYRPAAETPFDHVQAAREQGNSIVQSFHESMSQQGGRLNKVLADVVAFANARGGMIYVGVSASTSRKGAPRGVPNPTEAVSLLKKEIERNITPPLNVPVDVVESMDAPVIRVSVPNGADKPYALGQTRIYVRQEGETNEAMRDELVQLVLAHHVVRVPVVEVETPAAARVEVVAVEPGVTPELSVAAQPDAVGAPSIGVEIVTAEERKGTRYFSIRDLRNGNTIHNITMGSARKLWSYALNQYTTNPVDPAKTTWSGDLGLWQVARRVRRLRYDLALRQPDGSLRVFYGVTSDGMSGPWGQFLKEEDRVE
ncbi:MAG: transcriptional regulator [Chloroflexi bacterium HGW-Chloroflexi-1]|nr:MAG: transcriptional regulator [Chloroflexi bacterium HGW-Chloroflexi-1]